MITVWALVWFFVTDKGNMLVPTQIYATQADCKAAGDEIYAYSKQLEADGKIKTYGGACHQVQVNTKAGSV